MEQLNNEKTLVEIIVGSGVTYTMTLPGQTITLTIDQGNISLTSDQPLPANMVFETSGGNNSVILTNPNQDPSMNPEFMVGDHTCTMGENSSVGLAVAPESADREFSITLPGVLSFNFNFTSDPTVGELTITALQGTIKLDGEELPLNTPVNPGNGDEVLPTDISGPSTGAGAGGGDPAPTPGPTPTETEGSPIQP
ncbi:MAG: hypothetical protein GY801_20495 [bacterium]|nr:hypothetical protein [bacterium]